MKARNLYIVATIALAWVTYLIGLEIGKYKGAKKAIPIAFELGVDRTLDTIKVLMDKQIDSDSTVTKIGIGTQRDTIYYYLSPKTIK